MFLFDWFCSKNEQNEKPTITDMPYSVMSQILDKVGFLGTLNLRKTCKTFRNFIDDVKPINDLKQLRITLGHFYVQVEVFLDKNGYDTDKCSFVLSYQQAPDDNSWLIFKLVDDEVEFVKKMDEGEFIDAFFHDFESILKNQKSKLAYLKIKADSTPINAVSLSLSSAKKSEETIIVTANEANRGHKKSVSETINRLETILKCRSVPLQTKRLLLMVFESSQVIQILRYVKTEELGALQPTREADLSEKKRNLRFDEISKCETYENIRDIRVLDFVVTNPISDFLDKPVLIIRRIHVSEDDILNLKRAFLTSSHLKRWQLQYEDSEGDGSIHDILGRMPHEEQEKWFYGIPNSTEVLCIQSGYQTVLERVTVSFTRINLVDVPENAWVDWE